MQKQVHYSAVQQGQKKKKKTCFELHNKKVMENASIFPKQIWNYLIFFLQLSRSFISNGLDWLQEMIADPADVSLNTQCISFLFICESWCAYSEKSMNTLAHNSVKIIHRGRNGTVVELN